MCFIAFLLVLEYFGVCFSFKKARPPTPKEIHLILVFKSFLNVTTRAKWHNVFEIDVMVSAMNNKEMRHSCNEELVNIEGPLTLHAFTK